MFFSGFFLFPFSKEEQAKRPNGLRPETLIQKQNSKAKRSMKHEHR
jgi:hypothetical protein